VEPVVVHLLSFLISSRQLHKLKCFRYLVDHKVVDVGAGELDLALLCIGYLSFPGFDIDNDDTEVLIFVPLGYYGFLEYAYVYWSRHLDACLRLQISKDILEEVCEATEVFIDMHWIEPQTRTIVRKPFIDRWRPLENNGNLDRLAIAAWLAQRQLIASTKSNVDEQVLTLYRTVTNVRQCLEEVWATTNEPDRFRSMYGNHVFKCPRPNCVCFYAGFISKQLRDDHVPKHERSFFCSFSGCSMAILGCTTLKELHKHETEYHGTINYDDDDDELEYPELPAEKTSFQCSQCDAKFTRNNNLKIHMRKHNAPNQKAFICSQCGKSFARLGDRTRHESTTHSGAKTFVCGGTLKFGLSWGCGREFNRGDMLSRHWKSEKGKSCIRPKEQEETIEAANSNAAAQLPNSSTPSV
jgi:DNA-directed RNA polymerase subunit RPC12/RpoP